MGRAVDRGRYMLHGNAFWLASSKLDAAVDGQ